jgi:hypothetical protein
MLLDPVGWFNPLKQNKTKQNKTKQNVDPKTTGQKRKTTLSAVLGALATNAAIQWQPARLQVVATRWK